MTGVTEVVPFLAVADMRASLAFYVDGLGFVVENRWIDDGVLRWCQLRLGSAAVMLQQFRTQGHDARRFSANKGEGVMLCFFCTDAVAFYRTVRQRGIAASEPQVGNRMWVTEMKDPDGYQVLFESPTDVPEETKLSELPAGARSGSSGEPETIKERLAELERRGILVPAGGARKLPVAVTPKPGALDRFLAERGE